MLQDITVLVVERQFLIAMDVQRVLEEAGAARVIFARSVTEAISLVSGWPAFGLAVVEHSPDQPDGTALAADLAQLGIPLILLGSEISEAPAVEPKPPVLLKPFSERQLLAACAAVLRPA